MVLCWYLKKIWQYELEAGLKTYTQITSNTQLSFFFSNQLKWTNWTQTTMNSWNERKIEHIEDNFTK